MVQQKSVQQTVLTDKALTSSASKACTNIYNAWHMPVSCARKCVTLVCPGVPRVVHEQPSFYPGGFAASYTFTNHL
jgi:hypothetical protein